MDADVEQRSSAGEEMVVVESDVTTEGRAGEVTVMSAEDLSAVRELALRAYPDTVPELIGGESVAAILGSVEAAAAAYRRIAEGVVANAPTLVAPTVPAGSAPPVAIDPETLPSVEKIRRGLAARR
jgi:hypothetical protein